MWTHRLLLEAEATFSSTCFVTLTYSNPPEGPPRGNLSPRDLQLFLKRVRARVWPAQVRYFAVGEYGERTYRPHYHLIFFGLGPEDEKVIDECWGHGFVCVLPASLETMQYVVGYVAKKIGTRSDPRLMGRVPVFARMSRGLGRAALPAIADFLVTDEGAKFVAREADVPAVLRQGQKLMPLGRFLRGRLRIAYGADKAELPPIKSEQWRAEMFALRRAAGSAWVQRQVLAEDGRYARMVAREALKRGGSL